MVKTIKTEALPGGEVISLRTWVEDGERVFSVSMLNGFRKDFISRPGFPASRTGEVAMDCYRAHARFA